MRQFPHSLLFLPFLLLSCTPRTALRIQIERGTIRRIVVAPVDGERRTAAYAEERVKERLGRRAAFGWTSQELEHDADLRVRVSLYRVSEPFEIVRERPRLRENRARIEMVLIRANDDRIVWRDWFEATWFGDFATDGWQEGVDLAVGVLIDKMREDLAVQE